MNWHEELSKLGFKLLSSTSYYTNWGYYKDDKFIFLGSIEHERKGKILEPDFDLKYIDKKMVCRYYPDDAVQVFCPFIRTDNDKRPNSKPFIVLRNIEEVKRYIAELVELVDTQVSNTCGDETL